jgi:large subunit ribosomal protein L10
LTQCRRHFGHTVRIEVEVRAEKKYAVEEFRRNIEESSCAILTNYSGISAEQLNTLRSELKQRKGKYQVVKNRLFSLAASDRGIDGISGLIDGQVGVVYAGEEESIDILKYLVKFRRDNDVLDLLGGILGGVVYEGKDLQALSRLPGMEVMRAKFAGVLKAPLSNFAQVMRSRLLSVLYVVNAIIEKRGENDDKTASE